ncbi:LOW QUALITY PROTEIN: uncharacterized protein [Chelonus insularis]|uniref:LOW QUALITY PROTEIN: uncharacterized protein n=1 Tax=Chelonus insularis TaxID=460826 RepID=UPI001589EBAF|nr:LOW QUALITY PROTEIN: uncharacterized protein LOC118065481 [Chelonus insularis]
MLLYITSFILWMSAKMYISFILSLFFFTNIVFADEDHSPRIVIIGAGVSGIGAASRLLENGFKNVTVLEAEDRIGGRVYSVQMGDYMIDIGGQWVHGEERNVVFELVWPLGVLEKFNDSEYKRTAILYGSSGEVIPLETTSEIIKYHLHCVENIPKDIKSISLGEYMENKLEEFFKNHTEITPEQQRGIVHFLNLFEMGYDAADDWHQVSAARIRDTADTGGDHDINWKNRTYSFFLDILMKKYPNPEEALPVEENTMLNSKVTKIQYDSSDGSKKVITKDGKEYPADHIIWTGSLGVLKADHEKIFDPPLPQSKVTVIENLGMGHVAKLFLYFENPWWDYTAHFKGIFWTDADKKEIENDPAKKWLLLVYSVVPVEHKPKLLCLWLTGSYVPEMELIDDDILRNSTLWFLNKFFGHSYNLTELSLMRRSQWNTNENFRGTYSFPSIDSEKTNSHPENLAEPIIKDGKPSLQFAGEATSEYYGTVNGALGAGWREADRLINLYKPSPKIVIIGAGPAGIAAASMLFEKGFKDVKILEAENRIGGRVYSVKFGDYMIDLGGQWVHGEEDNISFELAWPLGLLEHFNDTGYNRNVKLFSSGGEEIFPDIATDMIEYHIGSLENLNEKLENETADSLGDFLDKKFNEYFQNHPEITPEQQKAILWFMNLFQLALHSAPDWHLLPLKQLAKSSDCKGDQGINWKNRTYSTILDILMKKFPNPKEALPVEENTMLNSKVTKIQYDSSDGSKKVITKDGKEYPADHIIWTGSLGVLKADHEKIFDPPLPQSKVAAIEARAIGGVAKIFFYFENPWWMDGSYLKGMIWTDADRKEIENDPTKKWMLSVYQIIPVENKPKLLCVWLTGPYIKDMEILPEDVVRNETLGLLNRFFGKTYNVTEPSLMIRSQWMTNENFRGTYSYPTMESEKLNIDPIDLGEPIMKDGKPNLQFAGEATAQYYATVHGAINSGQREAQRIVDLYSPSSRIIIVGAGAAGIAAASKLFENGFINVTILEAENRIGGRVYTINIGEYLVDMGGQWVHGEKNNIAFELAWPLGLLERFGHNNTMKTFASSGSIISDDMIEGVINFHTNISADLRVINNLTTKSFGEYAELRFANYFKNHPEIKIEEQESLLFLLNLIEMAADGGDDWFEVSAKGLHFYKYCEGDLDINWKERTYGTILDILMKRYPNPEEELPVLNNTILNSKVIKINYNVSNGSNKIITEDGKEYFADHVIFTGSLGVLKSDHETLFDPLLSEKKINTIKNLGMGHVAKIYLYYENPWWMDGIYAKMLYWTNSDRKKMEKDDNTRWMLGVYGIIPIEHKPKLLCLWMSGIHSREMELIPDELFRNQTLELIKRFFGQHYNITEPSVIKRTTWNSNVNFRGTYSFRSVASESADVYAEDLAEPIMKDSKPILQFGGEATDQYYSTVHGAIDSGFREANRLISFYAQKKDNEQ